MPLVGDPCVYTRGPPGPQQELVACWVDDIIFLNHRDDHAGRTAFDSLMKSEFKMSEWTDGESDFILNIRIDRDWEAGGRAEKSKLLTRQDAARASTELQTYADADFAATSTPISQGLIWAPWRQRFQDPEAGLGPRRSKNPG